MKPSRFQAVIFDLDGVLADTAHYHFLAWRDLAHSLNSPFDQAFNEELKGVDRLGSLERILARSPRQFSAEEKQRLALQKNLHYQQLISTMSPAELLPGALAALQMVRQAGLKIGLASVSKNAFPVLEMLGIRAYFDDVVDAALLSHSKPHPEIFLTAAAHLGVAAGACLGIEDALAGIASIKAAGMFALGIGDPAVLHTADCVLPDLRGFLPAFLAP